jgi:hypothetical protein
MIVTAAVLLIFRPAFEEKWKRKKQQIKPKKERGKLCLRNTSFRRG